VLAAIFNFIGWTLKNIGLGFLWTLKKIGVGVAVGGKWTADKVKKKAVEAGEEIKEKRERKKIEKENPQITSKAEYDELKLKKTGMGDYDNFVKKLLEESLIIAVTGKRGSGKSALGFRVMENIQAKAKRPCYVLGVGQKVLPEWINSITEIDEVGNGGVVLVDEGAISFSSRDSMSKKNKELGKLLAIARHKDMTLILVTQNTGMLDKNVLNLTDTIMLKEGSLLQKQMERPSIRKIYDKVDKEFKKVPHAEKKANVYIMDAEFEGIVTSSLPSFWSSKVSKNQA